MNKNIEINSDKAFDKYFENNIYPLLIDIQKNNKRNDITIVISMFLAILFLFVLFCNNPMILIIVLCFILSVTPFLIFDLKKSKVKQIKEKTYKLLFQIIGNFNYEGGSYYDESDAYKDVTCLPFYNILPYVEDKIVGIYKGLNIEISEIELNKTGPKREIGVFSGLIIKTQQLKKTDKKLIIRNKLSKATKDLDKTIITEDWVFNKIYHVSGECQIEARYILTPIFMEKLKILNNKNVLLTLCFSNDSIYICVESHKNYFEPNFDNYKTMLNSYRNIIQDLKSILEIIDILKLNIKPAL